MSIADYHLKPRGKLLPLLRASLPSQAWCNWRGC